MTLDEIKELAGHRDLSPWVIKLVQDAVEIERENAKGVFEELEREVKAELINAINCAVEIEREACAKACEEIIASVITKPMPLKDIAAAIRARGEK